MLAKLRILPLLALPLIAPACADSADPDPTVDPSSPLASGADFVAIPRHVEAATTAARRQRLTELGAPLDRQRAAGSDDFYLAIRKSALHDKWFLSAFLEQYYPGAVGGGAANSLGTRVVSFEIQNDKLFVFDVDDRAAASDVFDPQRIVEAYPLVRDKAITRLPGASQYVFIDPAAGLNRFDFLSDAFAWSGAPVRFATELSFLQNFEALPDGASFEQVFTGYADQPIGDGSQDPNVFRASGTMSFALRRYREGAGYQKVALPAQEHYFRSDPWLVEGTGALEQVAAHWDLHPGMEPIEWVISPTLAEWDARPAYADVDLVDTVAAAIVSWNDALGFEAFTTRLGDPDESFARDDLNYIIFDPDPSLGYAYANWRTNPNTGEIRGASVYFGAGWIGLDGFTDDEVAPPDDGELTGPTTAPAHPEVSTLRWGGTANAPLCVQWAHDHGAHAPGSSGDSQLTAGEKLEKYLGQMIVHEIGHDLGLRHNFKGSLAPPSSSVMEYSNFADRIAIGDTLGSYDIAAIRYLYGLSPDLPSDPFCTDDQYGVDPDCRIFDTGANPLDDTWAGEYRFIRDYFVEFALGEEYAEYVDYYAFETLDYAQTGYPEQAEHARDILFEGVASPVDPALLASNPNYPAAADLVFRRILLNLAPAPNLAIAASVDDQLGRVMRNEDGIRSLTTRRLLVDILEAKQTLEAYRVLLDARAVVDAELAAGLSPDDELRARDLQLRIDRATSPYFD